MSSKDLLIQSDGRSSLPDEYNEKETIQVEITGETEEEELDVLAASETGAYPAESGEFGEEDVRSADGMRYKSTLTNGEKVRIFGRIQKNINDLNALCEEHYALVVTHPDPSQHLSFYGSRSLVRMLYQSSLPSSLKSGELQQKNPTYMPVAEVQYVAGEEESPEAHLYSKVLRLLDLYNFPSKEHFSFKQRGTKKVNNARPKPDYWPTNVKYVPLLSGHMANILEDGTRHRNNMYLCLIIVFNSRETFPDPYALSQYTRRTLILRVLKYVRNHYRTLVNMLVADESDENPKNSSFGAVRGSNRLSSGYKERRTYTLKRKIVIDQERRARIDAGAVPVRTWEQIKDQNMDIWSAERRYNLDDKPSTSEGSSMPKLQRVKIETDDIDIDTPIISIDADECSDHPSAHSSQILPSSSVGDTVFINGQEYTVVPDPENPYSPINEINYSHQPSSRTVAQDILTMRRNDLSGRIAGSDCLVNAANEMGHCYTTDANSFEPPADLILAPAEDDDHQIEAFHPNVVMQSSGVCRLIKTFKYERQDGSPGVQKYVVKTRRNEGS